MKTGKSAHGTCPLNVEPNAILMGDNTAVWGDADWKGNKGDNALIDHTFYKLWQPSLASED